MQNQNVENSNLNPEKENVYPAKLASSERSGVIPAPRPSVAVGEGGKAGIQAPVILLILLSMIIVLILGIFLGKTYFSSAGQNSSISATPTSVISSPTAQPTVDPTANWKTYKNEKYGFEFKYPNNVINSKGTDEEMRFFQEIVKSAQPVTFGFYIEKNKNTEGYIEKIKSTTLGVNSKIDEIEVKIGKNIFTKLSYPTKLGSSSIEFTIQGGENLIIFYNADQILSTFKFTDNRIVLTPDNIQQYLGNGMQACNIKFNQDKANMTSDYANSAKGISFSLPYNSEWGNEKYRINPFDEVLKDNMVFFGNLSAGEGCGRMREISLRFLPVRSIGDSVKEVEERQKDMCKIIPTQDSVSGLTILRYSSPCGIGQSAFIQIIGKKFNYEFFSIYGDAKGLEDVVKTVKLIN